jgi:hypothetical protein
VLAFAAVGAEVNAGECADRAAQTDHDLAAPGGRQGPAKPLADLAAERLNLARLGRIVGEKAPRGPHGA